MDDLVHNENLLMRYLDNELSTEERSAVEQRLQSDEAFRNQLLNLQVAIQAIKQWGTTQVVADVHRQMMQELKAEKPAAKVIGISKAVKYTMAVAASVLVLFIGVRLFLNTQASPDKLYNQTFVDYDLTPPRGDANQVSTIEKLYQQKNYSAVVSSVHSLQLSGKDSLLTGLSYLHNNNFSAAVHWFHALASRQNEYQQDAEFYLSLSYLKNKEYSKALPLMQTIYQNPSHLYHQQLSADVIEEVKKLNEK